MKILLIVLSVFSFHIEIAQTLSRQTISSGTGGNSQGGVSIRQTIGQPYQTNTNVSENVSLRPGFQQPVFSTEIISATVKVRVIPNPALQYFTIESSDTLHDATLSVFDEIGRLVYSETIILFTRSEVYCALWANGIYYVTVADKKNNLITTKLIKHQ